MARYENTELPTVTVTGSRTVATPDGRVAIVLETKEQGSIAFEVDVRAIAALRQEIATAESFLRLRDQKPQA